MYSFCGPKGHENLAQGSPWVLVLSPEALKGRPLKTRSESYVDPTGGRLEFFSAYRTLNR
jgi:hypothetical protein